MAALDCLRWQKFSEAQSETMVSSTEGGRGVPRFDGSPGSLQEYAFRVRLRAVRESSLDEGEKKKIGPLGLRLVDGLSGGALQVVREIDLKKLAKEEGPELLLTHLYAAFRPRRQQEARELYQAGAQNHGILSRQHGEPMTSYLLRRRTWYKMLCDLDDKLALPEAILSEQVLMSSGISHDHMLMVRTALGGDMSVNRVCDELIAQHPHIHELELKRSQQDSRFHKSGKGKSMRTSSHSWNSGSKAYAAEDWDDAHSQSLGGYEDYEQGVTSSYYTGNEEDPAEHEEAEIDFALEAYAALVEDGLDENNTEAIEYASEIVQAEAEAMFLHNRAQSQGHTGFGGGKGRFSGKGKSKQQMADRRAAVEAMKKKTACRRCGQIGHWSTDYICPKYSGGKKGAKSTAMTGTTTTASSGGKKSSGKGSGPKPRVVYFTVTEYDNPDENMETQAMMAMNEFGQVPPPSSMQSPSGLPSRELTADELLDIAIQQAAFMQSQQTLAVEGPPVPEDAEWEASELGLVPSGDGGITGSAPSTPGDRTLGPREVLPQDLAAWDAEVLDNGQQKGQTFRMVAETEQSYCNYLTGQHRAGKIKNAQLQEFAKYLATRSGTAMMAYMGPSSEDMLLCILDTGCNNTCHGAGWVARYTEMTGLCPELQPHHGRVRGVGGNVQVVGLRQIPVLFALKNGDIASGMITSTELSGSDAPLLLSTKAQRSLGLVIDTEEQTVFSKRMNNYLEIVDRDGLPAIRLIPSTEDRQDVALQVDYASEGDDSGNSSNETMSPNDTTATSPSSNATSDVDSNATEVDKTFIEEEDTLCYINLLQEPKKIMTKGQRKKMADSTEDLKKEDLALWGTLRQERGLRRPHRLLPHGCRCFILELFAGAAMVTALASSWGLPVGKPIDVTFDASHDLLKSANRTAAQAYIEEMDPFVVVAGPKCGPWPAHQMHFNYELSADVFEIHDCEHHRHSVLSLVDLATHFHVAVRVAGGGTPSSKACADALNASWLSWAGAPTYFVADQGVRNKGKVSHLLTTHGTTIRQTGARAPHQLGVGERHGGLLKEIMRRVIHERRIHGAEEISALCSEAARVKNTLLNQHGYSPSQWVMGYQPGDVTSLANNDPNEQLGNHQVLIDAEDGAQDIYAKQLLIRQWAKEAYIRMDTSQRVRRALLRKSVTPVPSTSTINAIGSSTLPTTTSEEVTPLTRSLRADPDRLDGIFSRRPPSSSDSFMAQKTERKYKKKTQKVGAGRELHFMKETPERQKKLLVTRGKEWSNWMHYSDGRLADEQEVNDMKKENPNLRVIPTRWVDTDKSEIGEEERLKSRLVVRGDLEDSSLMRCDSPTCSLTMLSVVLTLAACRNSSLWSGDISAAFLQGSKLNRVLVLSLPKDGVPGVPPNMYYIVSSTVYGTRDAPLGWWKNLDGTVGKKGFKPVPYEPGAYTLLEDNGELAGLLITHVDDLMWTGGATVEARMDEICKHYNFGKVEKDTFRYCGRNISRDETHIYVKCDNLIDRVRPVWLTQEQKRREEQPVPESIRGQLRSIIGSLAWLARVCRPDLAYAVCRMQMAVHSATFGDVKYANSVVNLAMKTKDSGLAYPIGAFTFENAMILAIQDASRKRLRSQDGLPQPERQAAVLGSTLQAETLSLLAGSEEADHLRFVLYGLRHPDTTIPRWQVSAMDEIFVEWVTDCKSLCDHGNQSGLHVVSDKRLAIDMCGLRQTLWRLPGEEVGDPLATDTLPTEASTKLTWTSTDKMHADMLTKGMQHEGLQLLMKGETAELDAEAAAEETLEAEAPEEAPDEADAAADAEAEVPADADDTANTADAADADAPAAEEAAAEAEAPGEAPAEEEPQGEEVYIPLEEGEDEREDLGEGDALKNSRLQTFHKYFSHNGSAEPQELLCSSPKFCITMSKVEDFCINVNDISDIGLSRWAHVGALLPFSSLTDFFAIDNLFGDEFMKVFAEAAGKGAFPSLRLMYLYGNAIGDDGFEALTEAMAQDAFAPKGLETLLVMGNKITDKGAVSLWKPMQLGRLRLLRSFGIGNGVSDEGLQMLVEGGLQGNLPELSDWDLSMKQNSGLHMVAWNSREVFHACEII
eukprot:g16978.t1